MPQAPITLPPDLSEHTVAFTGHRPDKLGGYTEATFNRLRRLACCVLVHSRPAKIISGMAQGWDMAVAYEAIRLKIPCIAAIPFVGQESVWPKDTQRQYHAILDRCADVQLISPGEYAGWKMQRRNQWMVDNCDHLIALWDGSTGGTYNCVSYARLLVFREQTEGDAGYKESDFITNVWPLWLSTYKELEL